MARSEKVKFLHVVHKLGLVTSTDETNINKKFGWRKTGLLKKTPVLCVEKLPEIVFFVQCPPGFLFWLFLFGVGSYAKLRWNQKKKPPQKQGNSPKKDSLARSGEAKRTTLDDEWYSFKYPAGVMSHATRFGTNQRCHRNLWWFWRDFLNITDAWRLA